MFKGNNPIRCLTILTAVLIAGNLPGAVALPDSLIVLPEENLTAEQRTEFYYLKGKAVEDSSINLALEYFNIGLDAAQETRNTERTADFYFEIGRISSRQSDYPLAMEYLLKAFEIYDSLEMKQQLGRTYLALGSQFWYQDKYEAALENYEKAYRISAEVNDSIGASYALGNSALCYTALGNYEEALMIHRQKLELSQAYDDAKGIGMAYLNIGSAYYQLHDYKSALEYYRKAEPYADTVIRRDAAATLFVEMSAAFLATGDLNNARVYCNRGYELSKSHGFRRVQLIALERMAQVDSAYGNYRAAYHTLLLYHHLNEEIKTLEKDLQNNQMENRFNTRLERREKEMLEKENLLQKKLIMQSRRQRNIVMGLALILFVLSGIIIWYFIQYRRINRLLQKGNQLLQVKNQELNELNATRNRFFSIIAHDIKNPLSTTMGLCEVLHTRYDKLNEQGRKHYISNIDQSVNYLYKLLENLLQWSRAQTGALAMEPVNFPISEVLDQVRSLFRPTAEKKQIRLEITGENQTLAYGDISMISTVLRNLVHNALKYTPKGGVVSISSTNHTHGRIKLEVKDTGRGMSTETLSRLFRIDQTVIVEGNDGERGTGLGLILCKEFVEKNNGEIGVSSTPGSGSVFWIELPVSE